MSAPDTVSHLLSAAGLLGANALQSDAQGCSFEYKGNHFVLSYCQGPVGGYVAGEMKLREIRPERDAQQVLLGMYLNASLFRTAHFPIWYAIDPDKDMLCLLFSLNAQDVTAEGLAQIIQGMSATPLNSNMSTDGLIRESR
jgi:hypothetical protein